MKPILLDTGCFKKFGQKLNPGLLHNGHDYVCPIDTPVYSVSDGVVVFSDRLDGYGGCNPSETGGVLWIKYDNFYSLYSNINTDHKIKDNVKEGNILGFVHNYRSDSLNLPHLHFCIWKGQRLPDPPWDYVRDLKDYLDPMKIYF